MVASWTEFTEGMSFIFWGVVFLSLLPIVLPLALIFGR